jgi:DNA invertase Pin-like site-specific DNA recombinase
MYIHDREEIRREILLELKTAFADNKRPAFIYDRVFTKQQEVTGTSLQQQEFKGKKYAQENEFHIAKSFITTESVYKTGRKIFNLMLDLAVELGVKDIVFMCTDRMSHNFQDWSRLKSPY